MARVTVTTEIVADTERVWEALTDPRQVQAWDGVTALKIPAGYPLAGEVALWRTRVGPFTVTLRDRIRAVEVRERLASTIDVAFVHLEEEYRLESDRDVVRVVSDNEVSSRVVGLGWLARQLTRSNVRVSMANLKCYCERA